jgi:hypothetical protein
MGKMSELKANPETTIPEDAAHLELQRLIRLNDRLQMRADAPYAVGAGAIDLIRETSHTILMVGSRTADISPDVYLNEARRLHGVNEKIEPITGYGDEWVGVLLNNATLIARLLEEAALAADRVKRRREETEADGGREQAL